MAEAKPLDMPSPAVIDYFLDTYIDGVAELRKIFPAVTIDALRDGVIRQQERRKAALTRRGGH